MPGSPSTPSGPSGWTLKPGHSVSFYVPSKWNGRIWPRTGCTGVSSSHAHCQTGDCTAKFSCGMQWGALPASLAEFNLDAGGLDFYDVSYVDGFNAPVTIQGCKKAGCPTDINKHCPSILQVKEKGKVIACKSACTALHKDKYCCTGTYSSRQKCVPTNYSKYFKKECPSAYSYAYDDATSTFACTAKSSNKYAITFC